MINLLSMIGSAPASAPGSQGAQAKQLKGSGEPLFSTCLGQALEAPQWEEHAEATAPLSSQEISEEEVFDSKGEIFSLLPDEAPKQEPLLKMLSVFFQSPNKSLSALSQSPEEAVEREELSPKSHPLLCSPDEALKEAGGSALAGGIAQLTPRTGEVHPERTKLKQPERSSPRAEISKEPEESSGPEESGEPLLEEDAVEGEQEQQVPEEEFGFDPAPKPSLSALETQLSELEESLEIPERAKPLPYKISKKRSASALKRSLGHKIAALLSQPQDPARLSPRLRLYQAGLSRRNLRQLSDSFRLLSDGRLHRAEVELHPAELGRVQIKMEMQEQQLMLRFSVGEASVGEALKQQLAPLRESLMAQGLQLNLHIEVQQKAQKRRGKPSSQRRQRERHPR